METGTQSPAVFIPVTGSAQTGIKVGHDAARTGIIGAPFVFGTESQLLAYRPVAQPCGTAAVESITFAFEVAAQCVGQDVWIDGEEIGR